MQFTYTGEDTRTFPTLGVTVTKGDTFDAPDDFDAPFVSIKKTTKATTAQTLGE